MPTRVKWIETLANSKGRQEKDDNKGTKMNTAES